MGQKQNSGKKKEYAVPTETMALLPLVPSRETPHPLLKSVKTRQMFPKALSAVRKPEKNGTRAIGPFLCDFSGFPFQYRFRPQFISVHEVVGGEGVP